MRARLAAAAERIIDALDALDAADEDLEDSHDAEAFTDEAEPSLGSTLDIDQRVAWRSGGEIDGEATGTEDDIASFRTTEAWRTDRVAADAARNQVASIVRRRRATQLMTAT